MKKVYYLYAWLLGWPFFYNFNKMIYALALRGLGIYNYYDNKISGEKWVIKNIIKNLGKGIIIFDVGANIGNYTRELVMSRIYFSKIYAFEPHPDTFYRLCSNVSRMKKVEPIMLALSDKDSEMMLFDRAGCTGTSHASFSKKIFSEIHHTGSNSTLVNVTTLDKFCSENNIESIDFLKIDVEGFESFVLRGGVGLLGAFKIKVIQFEFTQLNSVIGVFFKEFYDMLSDCYNIYRILPHGLARIASYDPTICEIFGYQNFIAIKKGLEIKNEFWFPKRKGSD